MLTTLTIITILIILFIIYCFSFYIQTNYNLYKENFINSKIGIPKVIIQTIKDKNKIPDKVKYNIRKFAHNYKHIIYDDQQCIDFFKNNKIKGIDNNLIILKFKKLNGAHKADLFRYYYLYINGGIYLDIKTELIKPIKNIFNNNYTYTVLSIFKNTIYQGIIATPPKIDIFKEAVIKVLNTPYHVIKKNYLIFTYQLYSIIKKKSKKILKKGLNKMIDGSVVYLFKEDCQNYHCPRGNDRYNKCCYVIDNNIRVIKTRYEDYGIGWI